VLNGRRDWRAILTALGDAMLMVHCPGCATRLQAPREAVGKTIRCAICGQRFITQLPDTPVSTGTAAPIRDMPREELHPGDSLGEYEILHKLGHGGMGTVWKALHKRLKRLVAIKVLSTHLQNDPTALARFEREIEAIGRLEHPNLVRAYDASKDGNTHFLVMEFLQGDDLGRVLQARGRLPADEACGIVMQALAGLQHAHEHGLVHRDIKPSNLMLAQTALVPAGSGPGEEKPVVVKILDLGVAHLTTTTSTGSGPTTITGANQMLGTPDYMAPEQIMVAGQVDIRADLYSLGCTLYHLLSGRPPFVEGAMTQKLAAHLFKEPPPLGQFVPDLPPGLAEVVAQMMAKKPEHRFATPADVARALQPYAPSCPLSTPSFNTFPDPGRLPSPLPSVETPHGQVLTPTLPSNTWRPRPRRRRWVSIAVVSAVVVLGVGTLPLALYLLPKKTEVGQSDGTAEPVATTKGAPPNPNPQPQGVDLRVDMDEIRSLLDAGADTSEYIQEHAQERLDQWRKAADQGQREGQFLVGRCYHLGAGVTKDPVKAVEWYRKAAEAGQPWAQNNLAACYEGGDGVPRDPGEAVRWYEKAAEQGFPLAQINLAGMYLRGDGVPRNRERAAELLAAAHAAGSTKAAEPLRDIGYELAMDYAEGNGVPRDPVRAMEWYCKAGKLGHVEAQYELGRAFETGTGTNANPVEAVSWYREAAARKHPAAAYRLGVAYLTGIGTQVDQRAAVHWFETAAAKNNVDAIWSLVDCYEFGTGVPRNLVEAVNWCEKAEKLGRKGARERSSDLTYSLGQAFHHGMDGKKKDIALASSYYRRAARAGHKEAQFQLGCILYDGDEGKADPVEAVQWFRRAAAQGHSRAKSRLGVCYEEGSGVEKNLPEAFRLYREAAEEGDAGAMTNLANCYEEGRGVAATINEAVKWYRKAANAGNQRARDALKRLNRE
jgi:TPR repeat protein/tRNA A-37 threonylcarbamoyl transferase component Bud32